MDGIADVDFTIVVGIGRVLAVDRDLLEEVLQRQGRVGNADGRVDVADGVFVISWLFRGGPAPSCLDTADVDDNGFHEITDVVYLLSYLFEVTVEREGIVYRPEPPRLPFPACGLDTTGGTADSCQSYPLCE